MMAPLDTAGLAVKQLEWNEYDSEGEPDRWDARCCMGSYYEIGINSRGYIVSHNYENLSGAHQSPDEAKAAAQAHYDACILSALEGRPVALADAIPKDTAKDSELAEARAALEEIARQKLTRELRAEFGRDYETDWEGGYDGCIRRARTVLSREKETGA